MVQKRGIFMLDDLEKFNYTTVRGLHSNGQAETGYNKSNQSLQFTDQTV